MNRKNKILLIAVVITTTMASQTNTSSAIPVISLASNTLNVDLEINPTDKEQNYIFQVSNYNKQKDDDGIISDVVSEVRMQYKLQVKALDILPIEFELYNYDNENNKVLGENLLNNNITENILMDFGEKTTQTYELKIKWKNNKDNYLYSKEIDCVQLVLNSEQVD